VFSLTFDQGRIAGYYPSTIIANTAPPTGSDKTVAYNLQVNKLFSKGASAFASDSLVYRDAKFAEDIGHVVVGSYGRSWTNQLTTGIATPLPGSRFFGDYAVADVALRAADIGQQAAFWQVAGVVNATLFQVEQAYWNLVLAKRVYEATTATGDQVRALAMRTERLFQTQETTRYGKAKVDAQLANLARQEDEALNRYLGASNALANLLDLDRRAVLLPADDASLETGATLELGAALEQGTARNPSIRLAEANATIAQLFKDQSRVQLRPDLTGTAVFDFLQDDSTFGYRTPGEALRGTRSPDIESQSYTLAFVRPWDNRGAEANFLQAQARLAQQTLGLEQTRRGVASQIALAVAASQSAQSRVESARRARELAESVFARAGRQRSLGVVGDFEVIVKSIDLLSADLDYQSALIDRRISEAAVYTAIGSLPQRYGERSAP
jgi:outer membrane protein TolC